jgi:hypothetical protein
MHLRLEGALGVAQDGDVMWRVPLCGVKRGGLRLDRADASKLAT